MTDSFPAIHPLGELGWTVALGNRIDGELHRLAMGLGRRIAAARLDGVSEIITAYSAVTVFFDPAARPEAIRARLEQLAREHGGREEREPAEATRHLIPTRYDGADLDSVAQQTGLSREEVIRRHAEREYQVLCMGFAPGFAYLGELDPALVLPRRSSPRTRVPPGSVAIAGAQTAVYPFATPGGWHLIGSTLRAMFDAARTPPALLAPGDRVRFEPVR